MSEHLTKVLVRWVDSTRSTEWADYANIVDSGSLVCESLGFLVADYEDRICVAGHNDPNNKCVQGAITIPRVAIVEMWELEVDHE